MKFCHQCGAQNKDEAKFCESCGTNLENIAPAKHNNAKDQKNKIIAPLIDFILGCILYCLCGVGHIIYLQLNKRGIILCTTGLLISVIFGIIAVFNDNVILTAISLIIGLLLAIYAAIDANKCTQAINEGGELPLLFGFINPEEFSRPKMIGVAAICVIALIALAGAIVIAVNNELSSQADNAGIIGNLDDNIVVQKSSDVQIKITYPYSWSAHIGDSNTTNPYEGVGDKTFDIDESDYDVIAAAVSKKDSNSEELKVEIIKDGKVVDKESTTKSYGTVSVSTIID